MVRDNTTMGISFHPKLLGESSGQSNRQEEAATELDENIRPRRATLAIKPVTSSGGSSATSETLPASHISDQQISRLEDDLDRELDFSCRGAGSAQ